MPEGGTVSLVPVCLGPPLERTKDPPVNQQKPSLAYVTAASETQHSAVPPHLELTKNPCNVMYVQKSNCTCLISFEMSQCAW